MVEFDLSVRNGVIIRAGETLRLPAVVIGRPVPEVKWTKDDAEPDKERIVIETEVKNSTLSIKTAVRTDHGIYQITGTNPSGTKSASVKVDVMGKSNYFLQKSLRKMVCFLILKCGMFFLFVRFLDKRCSRTSG